MQDEHQDLENSEEVSPVKLSVKATTAIIVVMLGVLVIFAMSMSTCSSRRASNTPRSGNTVETGSGNSDVTISSTGTSSSKDSENPAVKDVAETSSSDTLSKVEENSNNSTVQNPTPNNSSIPVEGVLKEVSDPALGAEQQSSGLVSTKRVYSLGNSYVYGVTLVILTPDGNNVTCEYFCPRKTYMAVKTGDSLLVSYQMDSSGYISVSSISSNR